MNGKSNGFTRPIREKVAARAHRIWEQEGLPPGREVEHWQRAEREGLDRPDAEQQRQVERAEEMDDAHRDEHQEQLRAERPQPRRALSACAEEISRHDESDQVAAGHALQHTESARQAHEPPDQAGEEA